jgi:outer membrane receptor protein involved in Fe transport
MRVAILSIFTFFISFFAMAQFPTGGAANMPKGRIFGKVVDSQNKPVEFATVVLFRTTFDAATKKNKDVSLKAMQSELNGDFSLSDLPMMGKMKLKISSVGYKTVEKEVAFDLPKMEGGFKPGQAPDPAVIAKMMSALEKDLGNIKLETDAKELEAVVVTGTKPLMDLDVDKKTFNVDKNIVTAGGTAIDLMRNIPSVQVDIDGNVKVRNAAPTLFIDGRPTTLSLDQIPADAIEKVEVITNPSAKYDASGSMAGILNIILKKNKKSGYNGMVNAGGDKYGGSNLMANFNIRQGKVNFSAMVMNMRMRNNGIGNSERTNSISDVSSTITQDITNKMRGNMTFARVGLDYYVTNRSSISIAGMFPNGKMEPNSDIQLVTTSGTVTSKSNRISTGERSFKPMGLQLGFKHNFPTQGEELTSDLNLFSGTNEGNTITTTNYLNNAGNITGNQIQKNIGTGSNSMFTYQIDYVKPLSNGKKIETGIRINSNNLKNENQNLVKGIGSDTYVNIPSASTNYESTNSVYAAYFSLEGKPSKSFSYKIGLRQESSFYDGKLLATNQTFSNKYPLNFFPSIFLSKTLKGSDQIQLSITRRVNRPNFFQIIPFVDYSDSLNIQRGNPNLVPEFTTSGELSYSKSKGSGTFLTSVYYKYTDNLITRYLSKDINPVSGKTDLINTFINANSSYNYGVEFTYMNKILRFWDITSSLNLYNSRINLSNIANSVQTDAMWTVFGKLNNNFTLPKKYVIQLSFDYQGKTNMPVTQNQGQGGPGGGGPPMMQAQSSSQGYIMPFYGLDLAIKKSFLKNDLATVTLSFNDIFRTRGNRQVSSGEGFTQTYYRLNNPQNIRLNLSFRFGQMTNSMFKKGGDNGMEQSNQQMQTN